MVAFRCSKLNGQHMKEHGFLAEEIIVGDTQNSMVFT